MTNPYINTDEQAVDFLRGNPPWEDRAGWHAFDAYAGGLATSVDRAFTFLHYLADVELTEHTMAMVASGLVDWVINDHGLACESYLQADISNANLRYMADGVMVSDPDVLAMVERVCGSDQRQ